MNFQDRLEDLRAKPEHVRRRIAFWSSLGITFVIFTFWISSFTESTIAAKQSPATTSIAARAASPGQSLVAGVGAFGKDVWELIFGPKKVTYSEIQVTPGSN